MRYNYIFKIFSLCSIGLMPVNSQTATFYSITSAMIRDSLNIWHIICDRNSILHFNGRLEATHNLILFSVNSFVGEEDFVARMLLLSFFPSSQHPRPSRVLVGHCFFHFLQWTQNESHQNCQKSFIRCIREQH